jgi:hypothetical protein
MKKFSYEKWESEQNCSNLIIVYSVAQLLRGKCKNNISLFFKVNPRIFVENCIVAGQEIY